MKPLIRRAIGGTAVMLGLAFGDAAEAQTERWVRVVGTGDAVPGVPGATFVELQVATINSSGQLAFTARFDGAGVLPSERFGLWFGTVTSQNLILRQGDDLVPFTAFGPVEMIDLNDSGLLAVHVDLQGGAPIPEDDEAIFLFDGPVRTQLIRKGEFISAGIRYSDFDNRSLRINSSGKIAFHCYISDPGDPSAEGYFAGFAGAFDTDIRNGDPAPGTGMNFDAFVGSECALTSIPGLTVAFITGSTGGFQTGIWRSVGGVLSPIALPGDPAPMAGFSFLNVQDVSADSNGEIAFRGIYSDGGPQNSGIFRWDGAITPALLTPNPAPELPGVTLSSIREPSISPDGRLVCRASLSGTGVTGDNDRAIYGQDGTGQFQLLARAGSPVPGNVEPGRIINDFVFPVEPMSGKNRILVRIDFVDGGGAYYVVELGIPESKIRGKEKRRTRKSRYRLRGRASDDEAISVVQFKIRGKKWRKANGREVWRKKIRIKRKRTVVRVRSLDIDGNVSDVKRVVIRKREPRNG